MFFVHHHVLLVTLLLTNACHITIDASQTPKFQTLFCIYS